MRLLIGRYFLKSNGIQGIIRRFISAGTTLLIVVLFISFTAASYAEDSHRVTRGLLVLYKFDEGKGDTIHDRSGADQPFHLKIEKTSETKWKDGGLVVRKNSKISSNRPAKKIINSIKKTNAMTVEAWVKPRNKRQKGPARIVTISSGSSQRNFTLGQDSNKYDLRLRTTATNNNGIPSTPTKNNSLQTRLSHIVYTRDSSGSVRVFLDGKKQGSKRITGNFSRWDDKSPLVLANEVSGNRPWLGTFRLVAIYSRALTTKEIIQNFQAGAGGDTEVPHIALRKKKDHKVLFFENKIAPLLARNCIECHDSFLKKGELDLSRKLSAYQGGESGKVIIPGKSSKSLMWELVESGDMPTKGEALTSQERSLVKKWIDDGAVWSSELIDPALYAHQGKTENVWVQRLTIPEYIETVRSAVGVDISSEARKILPPDLRADGFSNTAYNLLVDLKHVESYARLAEIIVSQMDVMKFSARFSKSKTLSTDATMRKFLGKMGKWLLRGPLDDREITTYCGIATTVASAGGNYKEAVSLIIEAMLQSPRFIYRIENQLSDESSQPVGDYELASRMSYILWGGPPDRKLLQAAENGDLQEQDLLLEQVQRMLKDPRAVSRSLQFINEWLDLDRLNHLNPDSKKYPGWDNQLAEDMREETLAFFKDVVWDQNLPLSALFNSQITYTTPELARHYGLQPKGPGLVRYDLSSVPSRGGLLTHGSLLTMGGDDASMVTRGLFVLHDVLRGSVKDPPPGLDITPVPSKPGLSQRGIAEDRIANVSCGACHSRFEPLAFGLEKFDGIGAYHEKDAFGNKLREDGEILIPGESKPVNYQTSAELMNLLAESERVKKNLTWKLAQFSLGRPLVSSEASVIDKIHQSAQKTGGSYSSLMTALVLSDLVQLSKMETGGRPDSQSENIK